MTLTRRRLLISLVGSSATALLAACGSQTTTSGATTGGATTAATSSNPAAGTTASATSGSLSTATAITTSSASPTTSPASSSASTSASSSALSSSATGTAASATSPATTAPTSAAAVTPIKGSGHFTYWGGLIFSDAANNLQVKTIQDWGKQAGVTVDAVMVNQNNTNQQVAAALQAGTMPDALDMGLDLLLQLSSGNKLLALDSLYSKVGGQHGGWLPSADQSTNPKIFGGHRTGIPFGTSGNLLNRRTDVLQAAGFSGAPATWMDLRDWAAKAQKPPQYWGMGFALSNVGDGNEQVDVLHSWGGRIADDAGTKCTIQSTETKDYLQFISDAYLKMNLFPPGVTSWDGAGDNNAYQSGKVLFIGNPGSVYLWMKTNDPKLLANSAYSAFPKGPKLQIDSQGPNVRAIPTTSKQQDAAMNLIEYLAQDSYSNQYFPNAIYGPVLVGQQQLKAAWSDPIHAGLLDLALHGTGPSYPDVNNAAYAEFNNSFLVPKMIQRVVINKVSVDQAMAEAQTAGQAIYAKYQK